MLVDGRDASGPDEGQHSRLPNAQREVARQHNSCCGSGRGSHPSTAAVVAKRPAAARSTGANGRRRRCRACRCCPLPLRASCPSPSAAAGPSSPIHLCRNQHWVQQQQQQQAANSSVLAQQMLWRHCWPVNGSGCPKTSELWRSPCRDASCKNSFQTCLLPCTAALLFRLPACTPSARCCACAVPAPRRCNGSDPLIASCTSKLGYARVWLRQTCGAHEYGTPQLRQLLKDKHVSILGDSHGRHLFTWLVRMLDGAFAALCCVALRFAMLCCIVLWRCRRCCCMAGRQLLQPGWCQRHSTLSVCKL